MNALLYLAAAWLPLWGALLVCRQRLRGGRLLMGAALAGFVGGMCCVELRRHGLLAEYAGSVRLPLLGLHLDDMLHFALFGAGGALLVEFLLDRAGGERLVDRDHGEISGDRP